MLHIPNYSKLHKLGYHDATFEFEGESIVHRVFKLPLTLPIVARPDSKSLTEGINSSGSRLE